MVQVLVRFDRTTYTLDVPSGLPDYEAIAQETLACAGIPSSALQLRLLYNDRPVDPTHAYVAGQVLLALPRAGIVGGKGGFGANLRAAGKSGPKGKTHSFGFCRDLNGRRLKSVNDEVRLRKWLSDGEKLKRDKLGNEYTEEKGAAGLSGWFLGVPTWAEGYKHKASGELVAISSMVPRSRKKTALCSHWLEARKLRPAPPGAPRWWGCEKGRFCDFAHGDEELRYEAKISAAEVRLSEAAAEAAERLNAYTSGLYVYGDDAGSGGGGEGGGSVMLDAVLHGLQAAEAVAGAKRRRAAAEASSAPAGPAPATRAPEVVNPPRFAFPTADGATAGWLVSLSGAGTDVDVEYFSHAVTSMRDESGAAAVAAAATPAYPVPDVPSLVEVTGRANFATVACAGLGVAPSAGGGAAAASPTAWYFEVEMVSDGVVQVGWAAPAFAASSDEGDGVGDHIASWAFDGARGLAWAGGESRPFGGEPWSAGDVVGCLLELQASAAGGPCGARLSYSLNGDDLGSAHVIEPPADGGLFPLFPVVSLEAGEVCRWNLGGRGFAYAPARPACAPAIAAVLRAERGDAPVPAALSCGAFAATERRGPPEAASSEPVSAAASAAATSAPTAAAALPPQRSAAQQQPAQAAAAAAAPPAPPPRPDLSALPGLSSAGAMTSVRSFEEAGFTLADLKAELVGRGLKAGGSYAERCERLLAVRGLTPEQVPPKLRGEGFPGPLLIQNRQ